MRLTYARVLFFQIEEVGKALKRNLLPSSQGGRITNSLMTMGANVCSMVFLTASPNRFLRHLPATLPSDNILSVSTDTPRSSARRTPTPLFPRFATSTMRAPADMDTPEPSSVITDPAAAHTR